MKLMILDDNPTYLVILRGVLAQLGQIEICEFDDPMDALEAARSTEFDLVLVDYVMPSMDGIEFVSKLRALTNHQDQPVIMVTGAEERQVRIAALHAGATDFVRKPVEPVELRARTRNLLHLREAQLVLRDQASWLQREVKKATAEVVASERDLIHRLSHAIDCRDGNTGEHIIRMAAICAEIARGLGLQDDEVELIQAAAPLHDVGKIGIPDAILGKSGRLDQHETELMRRHVTIGEAILAGGRSSLLRCAERIAGCHHERWDGAGYPRGLVADAIPLEGRIAAVADVFEALCADRIYRKGWPIDQARDAIRAGSGSHFDPTCVAAFEARWPEIAVIVAHRRTAAA